MERQFLEQNIQASLAQKELDLEDAIAIRQLKDINQGRTPFDCSTSKAHEKGSGASAAKFTDAGSAISPSYSSCFSG